MPLRDGRLSVYGFDTVLPVDEVTTVTKVGSEPCPSTRSMDTLCVSLINPASGPEILDGLEILGGLEMLDGLYSEHIGSEWRSAYACPHLVHVPRPSVRNTIPSQSEKAQPPLVGLWSCDMLVICLLVPLFSISQ